MAKIKDVYEKIAYDYLTNGLNIRQSYKLFHPKASEESLNRAPYKLLENVGFKAIKERIAKELDKNTEAKAEECLNTLYSLSLTAERKTDRIAAATAYLKFVKGEKINPITPEKKTDLLDLANRLSITQ